MEYPVRTPPLNWAVFVVLCATSGCLAWLVGPRVRDLGMLFALLESGVTSPLFLLLALFAIVLPIVFLATTGESRASGVILSGYNPFAPARGRIFASVGGLRVARDAARPRGRREGPGRRGGVGASRVAPLTRLRSRRGRARARAASRMLRAWTRSSSSSR